MYWFDGKSVVIEDNRAGRAVVKRLSDETGRMLLSLRDPSRFDPTDPAYVELDRQRFVYSDDSWAVCLALPRTEEDEEQRLSRFELRRQWQQIVIPLNPVPA